MMSADRSDADSVLAPQKKKKKKETPYDKCVRDDN